MTANTIHLNLAVALKAVMAGRDRSERTWRRIRAVMAEEIQARRFGRDVEDLQQEVSIKLLRAQTQFVGEADTAAYAFIRRVTRHAVIDRVRRDNVRPRAQLWRVGDRDPLERVVAPENDADSTDEIAATSEELLDRVLSEVDLLIQQSGKPVTARELSRLQAHARVLSRVHGKATHEIAAEIGRPDASKACVEKWVERGLPLLLLALERLSADGEHSDRRVIENLRTALAKRRTDAGKPRRSRRKPTEGGC